MTDLDDLRHEVADLLSTMSALTAIEIARRLKRRNADVRAALAAPTFVMVGSPAGRRRNARCYSLVELPVLPNGTGRDRDVPQYEPSEPSR